MVDKEETKEKYGGGRRW